jgi:Fic family protein
MRSMWSNFNKADRIQFSQNAKEHFRRTLLLAYLAHPEEPFTPTNATLAALCGIPEHAVKRYLKYWKDRGVFTTKNKRHLHHAFGWCNQRTIEVEPTHVIIARAQLENQGKVL